MHLRIGSHQVETDAGAAPHILLALKETLKQVLLVSVGDAGTIVGHHQVNMVVVVAQAHLDASLLSGSIFERIRQKVLHNLTYLVNVEVHVDLFCRSQHGKGDVFVGQADELLAQSIDTGHKVGMLQSQVAPCPSSAAAGRECR